MKFPLTACCLVAALAVVPRASAQNAGADRASAEALFNEGVALVAAKDFAEGCRKFEASQALDPTLGTELRLGDCYERLGKTASAWATFKHAQGVARLKGQPEREELARQRVEALEPQLAYLSIELEGAAPEGLVVERNGSAVPLASLGVAIPVDPGEQQVAARAPGYEPWRQNVQIATGPGKSKLRLPALKRSATAPEKPNPAVNLAPNASFRTQRTAGFVTGAVGVTSLLVASGLGLYAMKEGDRSKEDAFCPNDNHNGCTQEGVDLRDRARAFGTASTITFIAGAALVTTGVVLYATAPKATEQPAQASLELRAHALPGAVGTALRGTW
ncbi:MAG: putative rane protein [Polyangiaceae bacterium]|nr:putative rane protein [Polyangiaceae bacterium]